MSRSGNRSQRRLQRVRRVVQVAALLLPVVIAGLIHLEQRQILGSYYALSIGPVDFVDPLMALQAQLLTLSWVGSLVVATLIPVGLALVLGRVFCGWACPYNTLLEAWASLERRWWPARHRRQRRAASEAGNPRPVLVWGVFVAMILATVLLGFPLLSYLSPPGLLSSQTTQVLLGMGVGLELGLVGLLAAVEISLGRRWWCRQLCPVGTALGVFHTPVSLRVQHDADRCNCRALTEPCHLACPVDLVPKREHLYPSCLQCGLCLRACEATGYGALRFAFGPAGHSRRLPTSEETGAPEPR